MVDIRLHAVADSVVPGWFGAGHCTDGEVFTEHRLAWVESLEVRHRFSSSGLKIKTMHVRRNHNRTIFINFADCALHGNLSVKLGNDQVVDNQSGVVTVFFAGRRSLPEISFERVAAMEKLAHILTYVMP